MDGLLGNALKGLKSLEHDKKFPKDKIQHCNGIVLLHSMELGLFVSGQDASGVLLTRKDDGTRSAPLAVAMTGVGVGSLGFAEKETIMVLNQAAVDSITGGIPIKFGADAGLTNYIGGEVGADAGIGKAGLESSYAFSNSEGGIVSLEVSDELGYGVPSSFMEPVMTQHDMYE